MCARNGLKTTAQLMVTYIVQTLNWQHFKKNWKIILTYSFLTYLRSFNKNCNETITCLQAVEIMFDIIVFNEFWLGEGSWWDIGNCVVVMTDTYRTQNDRLVIYLYKQLSAVTTDCIWRCLWIENGLYLRQE